MYVLVDNLYCYIYLYYSYLCDILQLNFLTKKICYNICIYDNTNLNLLSINIYLTYNKSIKWQKKERNNFPILITQFIVNLSNIIRKL